MLWATRIFQLFFFRPRLRHDARGVGETSCTVDKDTDPANPLVIDEFICPDGQLALQAGCAGTGCAAWLFATIQDIDFVQCFYRIPPTEPNYIH
jgi:hypothetical protein